MLKRPADGAVLGKKARKQMEVLYHILMEEKQLGDNPAVPEDSDDEHETAPRRLQKEAAKKAEQVLKNYEKPMNRAIRDLRITENGFLWLFASIKKKQRAFASYRYLTDAMELGFGPAFREIVELRFWQKGRKDLS